MMNNFTKSKENVVKGEEKDIEEEAQHNWIL